MIPFLLVLALLAIVVVVLVAPLRGNRRLSILDLGGPQARPLGRAQAVAAALRDLEFDRGLGKLADEDYRVLRDRLTREGLALVEAQPAGQAELDALVERAVAALRAPRGGPPLTPYPLSHPGEREDDAPPLPRVGEGVGGEGALSPAAADRTCPGCGAETRPSDRFCPQCGQRLATEGTWR